MYRLSWNLGASASWNLQSVSSSILELLYHFNFNQNYYLSTVFFFGTEFWARVELCKFCCHKFAESLYVLVSYIQNIRTLWCWIFTCSETVNVCIPTESTFKCDDKNYWIISTVVSHLIILIYPVLSSEYPNPRNHDLIQCFVVNRKLICSDIWPITFISRLMHSNIQNLEVKIYVV